MRIGSIASYGMSQALQRFEASAVRTARANSAAAVDAGVPPVDPVHEIVETISAKHDFTANLAVFRTADEMTKRLLDIKV